MDVKALIKQHLSKHTVGFWIWAGSGSLLAFTVILLVAKIFFYGGELARQATDLGQRVTIHIASGEVDGNVRHTKRAEVKPAVPSDYDPNSLTPIVSKEGLAPAPLASITEQSDKGIVPIAGKDGTLPWKYYARPFTAHDKRPMVAIILTNLALSRPLTEDALKLPHNFTLSFSPYASDAKTWAREAREIGFESLVDLPMQPENYPISDPGPYGLLDDLGPSESSARLHWVLSRFPGFVGVLGSANEKLTPNISIMRPTFTELLARGVLFVYLKTPKNIPLADLLKSRAVYGVGADAVIDEEIAPAAIEKQLQTLVNLAKKQGSAIGIAHSYPPTLETLASWADTLAAQGVDLAPVSAVALKNYP